LYGRPKDHHSTYVHITVSCQDELKLLRDELNSKGVSLAEFYESYNDWGLTSIACRLHKGQRNILAHLPLWRARL